MAIRRVASGVSLPTPAIFNSFNWPLISTCGWRPGEKIRSLTCLETCSIVATMAAVDTFGGGGAAEVASEVVLSAFGAAQWGKPSETIKSQVGRRIRQKMLFADSCALTEDRERTCWVYAAQNWSAFSLTAWSE